MISIADIKRVYAQARRRARFDDRREPNSRRATRFKVGWNDAAVRDIDYSTRAGGWKTPIMVQRYAHLSPDHMRAAVEKLAHHASIGATGTKTGTREA